jgi:glycerol kinase
LVEKKYCVAIDQGTTGTRCIIFDHESRVVAWKYLEHEQIYPKPGWVEHNPMEIVEKMNQVIKMALEESKVNPNEIAAIGVTNQRETTILWDPKTGRPIYNAIVWQDTRTRDICEELRKENYEEKLIHPHTGLYSFTYFSGPKIQWILDNVPGAREKAKKGELIFGTIDTWCIWWLTGGPKGGVHVTDYSNASRTMLMNLKTLDWDPEILELLKIPDAILPEIRPSSDKKIYGYTPKDGPFGAEIPVCGDLGDQQGALVGQVCFKEGEAKNTYGTGCFMLYNIGTTPTLSKHGLLTTAAYAVEEGKCIYALEGSIAITGAAIQWLRDNLKIIASAPETEKIAESVSDVGSGGIYFVPAFSGLFAPYWDLDARGVIVGLTRFIRKEHLVHATLESICWQTRDVYEAMYADSGIRLEALKVDGGAVVNNYMMQLQADILGAKVIRPVVTETTSLGAAYMAGLAVGFWNSLDELVKLWKADRVFEPKWAEEKRERLYKGWKAAVERAKGWLKEVGELPPSGSSVS